MYSVYLIPSLVSKAVPFSASFALQNLLLRIIISEYVAKYIHLATFVSTQLTLFSESDIYSV
jgi:hypothetical protein